MARALREVVGEQVRLDPEDLHLLARAYTVKVLKALVRASDGMRIKAICVAVHGPDSTVTETIIEMCRMGFVSQDAIGPTPHLIRLTPRGRAVLEQMQPLLAAELQ